MSQKNSPAPIIGSIVERKPTSTGRPLAPKASTGAPSTGFPAAQHRSKSAFARNREDNQRRDASASRVLVPPVPVLAKPQPLSVLPPRPPASPPVSDDWRDQISRENEERVAGLTQEELEEERRQIIERFGSGISGVLQRAKRKRVNEASETRYVGSPRRNGAPLHVSVTDSLDSVFRNLKEVPISPEERRPVERACSPPRPALSTASSRPSSRADRRIRFADLEPNDVYVYESTPPSPRKPVLALPPPSQDGDDDVISLGQWSGRMAPAPMPILEPPSTAQNPQERDGQTMVSPMEEPAVEKPAVEKPIHEPEAGESVQAKSKSIDAEPEEGTPEYIRRRYFPDILPDDPNLKWMTSSTGADAVAGEPAPNTLRFDLHGAPIPPNLSSTLPTHLGLHHHAEGSHAGYTLDDIFLLSRSTVPAQRATMFGVLSGVTERLAKLAKGQEVDNMHILKGQEEELRKRIIAAGVEAMNERGSVGLRAIEVVWQSIVGWDEEVIATGLEGIQLESPKDLAIRSLPLDLVLPSIATIFGQHRDAYPRESLDQLLEIAQRLALQNDDAAQKIVATERLLAGIVQYFLITPLPPPSDGSLLPDPSALKLLTSLARLSRSSAETLSRAFADNLLRFITFLPPSSPFPIPLATRLSALTLEFYATLATYGLYSSVASTAMEPFSKFGQYISLECDSRPLVSAWLKLVQAWTLCAIDPHATTPPHDIVWSRISAWCWYSDVLQLLARIGVAEQLDWVLWGDAWGALSAWLEGSKVNGLRGGEDERKQLLLDIKESFDAGGNAHKVISSVLDSLRDELQKPDLAYSRTRMKLVASSADTLVEVIRLWLAFLPPHIDGPPSTPPFNLPYDRISKLAAVMISHPVWSIVSPPSSSSTSTSILPGAQEYRYNFVYLQHTSSFLSYYLRLSRRLPDTSRDLWLAQAFSIITRLLPGNEAVALNIVDELLRISPDVAAVPGVVWQGKDGKSILEPFVEDSVLPREKEEPLEEGAPQLDQARPRLSPLTPTPQSIQYATTATLPSPYAGSKMQHRLSGLPLHRGWLLDALDHLLHSGDSVVFKHLPASWDASEVEVTRVSFAFALSASDILQKYRLNTFAPGRGEAILACMKVFMLEQGLVGGKNEQSGLETEVFRDKVVESLMGRMLDPYRVRALPLPLAEEQRNSTIDDDLEKLATRFLGPSTPFYQFYTDFVGLYDAISFSHPMFALLLLPPLSMRHAIDYRKLVWCDYPHILKTIRIHPDQVVSGDLREYLYPIENNPQVLGAYLSALVKGTATEFMGWVALHQIASNIWIDLRDDGDDGKFNEERGIKLLQALIDRGGNELVSNIVKYSQPPRREGAKMPPDCFGAETVILKNRKAWVAAAVGEPCLQKLAALFERTYQSA